MTMNTAMMKIVLAGLVLLPGCLEDVTSQQPGPGVQCRATAECRNELSPICDPLSYVCRACRGPEDDARCRDRNPATPRCAMTGACGACRETGENQDCVNADRKRPTCAEGKCQACARAADCRSEVCLADGSCADVSAVVYVDNKNGACNTMVAHAGTQQDPMCDIQSGATRAAMDKKPYVRVAASQTPYAPVTISATAMDGLTLSGTQSNMTVARIQGDGPALTVVGAAARVAVTVREMELSSDRAEGVVCDQRTGTMMPELTIQRASIFKAAGPGLVATRCKLSLDGVQVYNNSRGGIRLAGTTFSIQNVMVYNNVSGPGIGATDAGMGSVVRFATIAYNLNAGGASGVDCGVQNTLVEHSIVAQNFGGSSQFRGCRLQNVVTGSEMVMGGTVGMPDFVKAEEPLDLHLKNSQQNRACCIDKIMQGAGLPDRDIDGRRRPQGAAWDIGAHEVQQ